MIDLFTQQPECKKLHNNPSINELRKMAEFEERTTEFGSASYNSIVMSRSAKFTQYDMDGFTPEHQKIIDQVLEYVKKFPMIQLDRVMCQHPAMRIKARYFVTRRFARIPFMWGQSLLEGDASQTPDMITFHVPEWHQRMVLLDASRNITFVLGTDYMGEIKKSFLRMGMWIAKQKGLLGLHAGSKLINIKDDNGRMTAKGALFFGLSGTGKTTLTCHHHRLEGGEGVSIRQDDVVFMNTDGYCYGTEQNFYIKTEGLEKQGQPVLYSATVTPRAALENIYVTPDGKVDFLNYEISKNGRAMVHRADMAYTDDEIDLEKAHLIFYITRHFDIVPPVIKLTPEQGAAFFMLGESIETAAGDPTKAGKAVRVVGTNPFIVGDPAEEGNWMQRFLKENPDIECFILNTGYVGGEGNQKITIYDSTEIIKQIALGKVTWKKDPEWGYLVPEHIPNVDVQRLDPRRYYTKEEYQQRTEKLRQDRRAYLRKFDNLNPQIIESV